MNKVGAIKTLIILLSVFSVSCLKKGEDDPSVSFRSRENRISQEWQLVNGYYTYQVPDTYYTFKLSPSKVYFYLNGQEVGYDSFNQVLTIYESGTFTRNTVMGLKQFYDLGKWFFGGENNNLDTKNKETIIFAVTSYVEDNQNNFTWSGLNNNLVYFINKLSIKELILLSDYSYYDDSLRTVTVSEYYHFARNGEEDK